MKEKLDTLDSLEVLSFQNQLADYPIHYHETYCVSLIQKGVLGENDLIAPQDTILISHPYEIHKNHPIASSGVSFTTFYISPDVINFISPYNCTSFQNKVIKNRWTTSQLKKLIDIIQSRRHEKNYLIKLYAAFYQFMGHLINGYSSDNVYPIEEPSILLEKVQQYISNHINAKINLQHLATLLGMSKFQFIRWFKSNVGITPFEYILLQRVTLGKKLIQQGMPLVDVSLEAGFYDQSHFSNYFKKYVGVSPKVYQTTCNIFQDI